jgi:hypothetical protein
MRLKTLMLLGTIVLALTPALATAQGKPMYLNVGGGPTFIAGDLGKHFNAGYGPAIGVTFYGPNKRVGFQFEYAYRWFGNNNSVVLPAATTLSANHQTHQLDFNLVANLTPSDSAVRFYVTGGGGAYYRKVEITQYNGTGVICDPYWYVCGTYPVSSVVGSRGGWDPGINVGAGIGLKIGDDAEFFIETRYHQVWGPQISSNTVNPLGNGSGNADGHYTPLTFGFRF